MFTPDRKLGCSSEQGCVTVIFRLLLLQNKPPSKSSMQADKTSKHLIIQYMVGYIYLRKALI